MVVQKLDREIDLSAGISDVQGIMAIALWSATRSMTSRAFLELGDRERLDLVEAIIKVRTAHRLLCDQNLERL